MQISKKKHFIEKVSKGKRIVSKSLEGDGKERAANIGKRKVLGGRIFDLDIAGMQEHNEIVSYQGWENLFSLPMPIMYEAEVTEFYSSMYFTDDDEIVFAEAAQSGEALGALMDLQEENTSLESNNAAFRK
ncbi:hypothetical protein HAX54_043957 [Datura stramonium]|uniref:Uncharacterized protein n=1 Tax=Datura stramonium TaxID=4076 RepID=A0ABS8SP11_DATST|nr:hypothetical protein [Datura stramonium]